MKTVLPASRAKQGLTKPSPYELGKEFFERNARTKPFHETARHSKRLLHEHFRGK